MGEGVGVGVGVNQHCGAPEDCLADQSARAHVHMLCPRSMWALRRLCSFHIARQSQPPLRPPKSSHMPHVVTVSDINNNFISSDTIPYMSN